MYYSAKKSKCKKKPMRIDLLLWFGRAMIYDHLIPTNNWQFPDCPTCLEILTLICSSCFWTFSALSLGSAPVTEKDPMYCKKNQRNIGSSKTKKTRKRSSGANIIDREAPTSQWRKGNICIFYQSNIPG